MESSRQRSSGIRSRFIPNKIRFGDPGLSRKYFTRKQSTQIHTNDLPMEPNYVGFRSPWAFLWYFLFLVAPLAYVYITLMLLRDLCEYSPEAIQQPLQHYLPSLAKLVMMMKSYYGCKLVDVWCIIEALFFIACKLKVRYLQSKDPLEACLTAAPMLDSDERQALWDRIVSVESDTAWISEWFLDHPPIGSISVYDILDFICWAMFDGRNQEHLTTQELLDLEGFVEDLEYRVSLHMYGIAVEEDSVNVSTVPTEGENEEGDFGQVDQDSIKSGVEVIHNHEKNLCDVTTTPADNDSRKTECNFPLSPLIRQSFVDGGKTLRSRSGSSFSSTYSIERPRPKKVFRFTRDIERERPNYFYNLYEAYKIRYERYKAIIENADFRPVQDFRQLVAEAEETALKSAQNMYEAVIQPGSQMDKHFSALSHATSTQLSEAWNSVKGMKERLETANFLSEQRKALMQQVRGNRAMLTRMREMSYAVNSKQMAALMRKITESYVALEKIEVTARDGILNAAGKLTDNSLFNHHEPKRYARYNSDPILGIATYPLGMHLFLLSATEIPLRVMLQRRGFERRSIGPVIYYYHPGRERVRSSMDNEEACGIQVSDQSTKITPVIFIHGIGVGLVCYVPLIDSLLNSGRPLFLPEIPYVSGFRPWQSSSAVLSPAVVASTMTAMLAYHGFSKGTFIGHSYGTSWLSYMCKYAQSAVAALLFLDPICFCLYHPHLTKSFVYHQPDPGSVAFIVRTDMMVSWTIQRAFPWTWIVLFLEQIRVPCTVFIGDKDALVPAEKIEAYLRMYGVPISDADLVEKSFFESEGDLKACVWRGGIHGSFTEEPEMVPDITMACNALCSKVEERKLF